MKSLITFLLLISFAYGQNVVSNPGFEFKALCPDTAGQIFYATPWLDVLGTPDYYNFCNTTSDYDVPVNVHGYQQERRLMDGYAGLINWDHNGYREVIEGQSPGPIFPYTKYYVTAYINVADDSPTLCTNLGMTLHQNFTDPVVIGVLPMMEFRNVGLADTSGWQKIEGEFEIDFQAQYFRIGNYLEQSQSDTIKLWDADGAYDFSYLFIDDICISVNPGDCGHPVGIEEPAPMPEMLWEFDGMYWRQVDHRQPGKMYKVLESK